jgi:hypothetical protein
MLFKQVLPIPLSQKLNLITRQVILLNAKYCL